MTPKLYTAALEYEGPSDTNNIWYMWVCGCVGVWVCGCVGVWVCGCVGVWVCGCVGVWVCGCGYGCGRACVRVYIVGLMNNSIQPTNYFVSVKSIVNS